MRRAILQDREIRTFLTIGLEKGNNMKSFPKIYFISSMLIFGTVGIFVRYIPLPSAVISLSRGIVGILFLLLACLVLKIKIFSPEIRKHLPLLCISGVCLGLNWLFLFEAYRHTTIATATLCYYLAPTIVILLSPIIFREKLTALKGICAVISLVGMVLVSGVGGDLSRGEAFGIVFGVVAASFYAAIMFFNKILGAVPPYSKTIVQLGASSVVMFIYTLFLDGIDGVLMDTRAIISLAVVGVIHTGLAYVLYFGASGYIGAQTAAILSYIDPVTAIAVSALILRENIGISELIGALLILGSAFASEFFAKKKIT